MRNYSNATEADMDGFAKVLASEEPNIDNRLLSVAMCQSRNEKKSWMPDLCILRDEHICVMMMFEGRNAQGFWVLISNIKTRSLIYVRRLSKERILKIPQIRRDILLSCEEET